MVALASKDGFVGVMSDFYITAALFQLEPLFPYVD
jgi:hypothetical protein